MWAICSPQQSIGKLADALAIAGERAQSHQHATTIRVLPPVWGTSPTSGSGAQQTGMAGLRRLTVRDFSDAQI